MQDMHGVFKPGRIHHSKPSVVVIDDDLFYTLADDGQGLEAVRLLASLDLVDLVAAVLANARRKASQIFQRASPEPDGFRRLRFGRIGNCSVGGCSFGQE